MTLKLLQSDSLSSVRTFLRTQSLTLTVKVPVAMEATTQSWLLSRQTWYCFLMKTAQSQAWSALSFLKLKLHLQSKSLRVAFVGNHREKSSNIWIISINKKRALRRVNRSALYSEHRHLSCFSNYLRAPGNEPVDDPCALEIVVRPWLSWPS